MVGNGADSVFLSLSSVASLLGQFHPCAGRWALLLSRQPGGALSLGCGGCQVRVDGVQDDLELLLRQRSSELQQTLGLDSTAQEKLLNVLLGRQELRHQQQPHRPDPHPQQQGSVNSIELQGQQLQNHSELQKECGSVSMQDQEQHNQNVIPMEKKKTK